MVYFLEWCIFGCLYWWFVFEKGKKGCWNLSDNVPSIEFFVSKLVRKNRGKIKMRKLLKNEVEKEEGQVL